MITPAYYVIEPETLERLRAVERRLYEDRPLSADARRDLANTLNALLGAALAVINTEAS